MSDWDGMLIRLFYYFYERKNSLIGSEFRRERGVVVECWEIICRFLILFKRRGRKLCNWN